MSRINKVSNYTGLGINHKGEIQEKQFKHYQQYIHQLDSDVKKLYDIGQPTKGAIADGDYNVGVSTLTIKNGVITKIV